MSNQNQKATLGEKLKNTFLRWPGMLFWILPVLFPVILLTCNATDHVSKGQLDHPERWTSQGPHIMTPAAWVAVSVVAIAFAVFFYFVRQSNKRG